MCEIKFKVNTQKIHTVRKIIHLGLECDNIMIGDIYMSNQNIQTNLNFENLVIQRISLLMFKYSHGDVPVSVSQLFKTNNEYHNYNTRNCARIHAPVGVTEASYRTFGYRGIHIWNHISQKIIQIHHIPVLKKRVKIYIDGHESKPAISILAIVQESQKTSAFRYFSTYSFHFIT